MSDRVMEWLDESQRLADEADYGPWKAYGRGGHSQPRVQSVVSLGSGGFVAHTGYGEDDERAGLDARFIAESRTRFPQAVEALKAISGLHRPVAIFASEVECPSSGDPVHVNDWHEENLTVDGAWYCAQMPLYRACEHCLDEDGGLRDWPCETARVVAGALGLEGDDDAD